MHANRCTQIGPKRCTQIGARKQKPLTLRTTSLDRSRWKYRGTGIDIVPYQTNDWLAKSDKWPICCCVGRSGSTSPAFSINLAQVRRIFLHGTRQIVHPVRTARTYDLYPWSSSKAFINWAPQTPAGTRTKPQVYFSMDHVPQNDAEMEFVG